MILWDFLCFLEDFEINWWYYVSFFGVFYGFFHFFAYYLFLLTGKFRKLFFWWCQQK